MSTTIPRPTSMAASASWILTGRTLGFVITTALPLVLARSLSLVEFGSYKQFFLLLMSAINLLPLSMQMSVFYFLPRASTPDDRAHTVTGVLSYYLVVVGLASGALMINPSLAGRILTSPALAQSGRLIGLTLFFFVISGFFECVTVAYGEARIGAAVMIGSTLARTLTILITALVWGSVQAIMWGTLIYTIVYVAAMLVYLESRFPGFWHKFDWRTMRDLLSYSIPIGVAGLLLNLQTDLHNYFVSHRYGPAIFAIYSQGLFQLPLVGILGDSVGSVLIPRVSVLQQQNVHEEIVTLMAKVMRILSLAYFPVWAFLTVMSQDFIVLLFTKKFLASVPIFQINLLLIPLAIVMVDPIMRAYKEQRFWMVKFNFVMLIALTAALQFGMPWFGLLGTIGCVVASQYIGRLAAVARISSILHFSWRDLILLRDVGKIAVASVLAGLAASATRLAINFSKPFFALLVCGLLYVGIYLLILLAWKVPTSEELADVRSRFFRILRIVPA